MSTSGLKVHQSNFAREANPATANITIPPTTKGAPTEKISTNIAPKNGADNEAVVFAASLNAVTDPRRYSGSSTNSIRLPHGSATKATLYPSSGTSNGPWHIFTPRSCSAASARA